jgi:anti-sigma regulatory factor (Ser/Thr protein kinase)
MRQAAMEQAQLLEAAHGPAPVQRVSGRWAAGPGVTGAARVLVREALISWRLNDLIDDVVLMASELAGNAAIHGAGPIALELSLGPEAAGRWVLLCEVADTCPVLPRLEHAGPMDEGGRGLVLVDALSDAWGARPSATGKTTWFSVTAPAPPAFASPASGPRQPAAAMPRKCAA